MTGYSDAEIRGQTPAFLLGEEPFTRITAELSETVELDGRVLVTPESLVFDIDDSGRIVHLAVYIQRQP